MIISAISLQQIEWAEKTNNIQNMNINRMAVQPFNDYANAINLTVPVEIEWIGQQSNRKYFKGNIHLYRLSPTDPWKIDSNRFLKEL